MKNDSELQAIKAIQKAYKIEVRCFKTHDKIKLFYKEFTTEWRLRVKIEKLHPLLHLAIVEKLDKKQSKPNPRNRLLESFID